MHPACATRGVRKRPKHAPPKRAFAVDASTAPVDATRLSDDELKENIQVSILAPLRRRFVYLTSHGNRPGLGPSHRQQPQQPFDFNLDTIRKSLGALEHVFAYGSAPCSSYLLKNRVHEHLSQYISSGECVVAVLMAGGSADFRGVAPDARLFPRVKR